MRTPNTTRFLRWLLPLSCAFSAPIASAWSGAHGADVTSDRDNAWFLGDAAISYCIDMRADADFAKTDAEAMITKSVAAWKEFFQVYGMRNERFGPFPSGVPYRTLTTAFTPAADCKQADVTFIFGSPTNDERVTWGIDPSTLGAAFRAKTDLESTRSRGSIWVRSFTKDSAKAGHLLMHELGHLFGMPHNSVAVMDENLADRLSGKPLVIGSVTATEQDNARLLNLGRVESPNWHTNVLRAGKWSDLTFDSVCNGKIGWAPNGTLPRTIGDSVSVDDKGCFQLKYTIKDSNPDIPHARHGDPVWTAKVTLSFDDSKHSVYDFEAIAERRRDAKPGCPLFYAGWREGETGTALTYKTKTLCDKMTVAPQGRMDVFGHSIPFTFDTNKHDAFESYWAADTLWFTVSSSQSDR